MRLAAVLSLLVVLATPVFAFEIEEIGRLQATFDGESIDQPTVLASSDEETSSTAFILLIAGGMSALSLAGYSLDNTRLGLEATYMTEQPGPQTVPINLTITYAPQGTQGDWWTSDDAPTPPSITFTTLEADGKEGRAVGTFTALLCYAENYATDPDTGNCRPIEGSFDTKIFVEQ